MILVMILRRGFGGLHHSIIAEGTSREAVRQIVQAPKLGLRLGLPRNLHIHICMLQPPEEPTYLVCLYHRYVSAELHVRTGLSH